MVFILLFVIGGMAIPLSIDIQKNGKDNILFHAWQDMTNSKCGQYMKSIFSKK